MTAFRIDEFHVEPSLHCVNGPAGTVRVEAKVMQVLRCLAEHGGQVVPKERLISAVWPDTFVSDDVLTRAISELRRVFGDDVKKPRFIQTIPKSGYRLMAPVAFTGPEDRGAAAAQPGSGEARRRVVALNRGDRGLVPRRNWGWALLGATGLAGVGVLVVAVALWRPHISPPPAVVPVTTLPGYEVSPSFSPDGTQIVFSHSSQWPPKKDGNADIYVGMVGTADVRRLTTDPLQDIWPSWSPDGQHIAFLRWDGESPGQIRLMSPLGGADRKLSDFPARGPLAWSPDSRFLVVGRWDASSHGLFVLPIFGGVPRALTYRKPPAADRAPALSADGRQLAYARCVGLGASGDCDIYVLGLDAQLAPAAAPRLLQRDVTSIGRMAWDGNGKSIVYDTNNSVGPKFLWHVNADGSGPSQRIEVAGVFAASPAIAPASQRLAFTRFTEDVDIYGFRQGRKSEPVVQSSVADVEPQYSPDGRYIAFASVRSGESMEIWRTTADGTDTLQLTQGSLAAFQGAPHWSPDGRRIAFHAKSDDGQSHIWVVDANGGTAKRVTTGPNGQFSPTWSHDGQWIYFSAGEASKPYVSNLWRIEIRAGIAERVTEEGSGRAGYELSDGRGLVYQAEDSDAALLFMPLPKGPPQKLVDCVINRAFAVHGDSVYYVPCQNGTDVSVHRQNLNTNTDATVGVLTSFYRGNPLTVSPDEQTILYCLKSASRADIMMISNFR